MDNMTSEVRTFEVFGPHMLLPVFCRNIVNYYIVNMANLNLLQFKCIYQRYFIVDVIEIFRTFWRKVDYTLCYNNA